MRMIDDEAEAERMIAANLETALRLESYKTQLPREKIISIETVIEQRRKVAESAARLTARMRDFSGPKGE